MIMYLQTRRRIGLASEQGHHNFEWGAIAAITYEYIHRVRKTPPPKKKKHVKITLWIENDSHYFSLYHEKPSICNVFVKFHNN